MDTPWTIWPVYSLSTCNSMGKQQWLSTLYLALSQVLTHTLSHLILPPVNLGIHHYVYITDKESDA